MISKYDLSNFLDQPPARFTVWTAEATLKTRVLEKLYNEARAAANITERASLVSQRKTITAAITVSPRF